MLYVASSPGDISSSAPGKTFRSKPVLVDATEEKVVLKYFSDLKHMEVLTTSERDLLKARIQKQTGNTTHSIFWHNLPDWLSEESWSKKFQNCLYSNCVYTYDRSKMRKSSAVMFCTTCNAMGYEPPLSRLERPADQVWIFMSMESPIYHCWHSDFKSPSWRDTMNWSMTFRTDSDVTFPYGYLKTVTPPTERNYSEIFRRKTKIAAWIVSHCGANSKRDNFVNVLQAYGLPVDIYGKCGVPLEKDPEVLVNSTYKFYLSLENSICKDYVSEKFFRYFPLDTILIVRGGASYKKLLPSDAFIDSSNFDTIKDLVDHILAVSSNEEMYISYLRKKDGYKIDWDVDLPFCDLCAKLNHKDKNTRVYHDIVHYIYSDTCHKPTDVGDYTVLCIVGIIVFGLYIIFITFKTLSCKNIVKHIYMLAVKFR